MSFARTSRRGRRHKPAIRPDDSRFHPHVTLGRFKPGRRGPCDLTASWNDIARWSCGDFTVDEVVGFASTLGTGRAELRRRSAEARLEGKKSDASALTGQPT